MGDRDGGEGESKCGGGAILNVCWGDECSVDIRRKFDDDGRWNEGLGTVQKGSDRCDGPADDSETGVDG